VLPHALLPLQADVTVRELVRALAKVVLLYAPLMGNIPLSGSAPSSLRSAAPGQQQPQPQLDGGTGVGSTWGTAWRAILDCLVYGMEKVREWWAGGPQART
jgi:hypothetical protein